MNHCGLFYSKFKLHKQAVLMFVCFFFRFYMYIYFNKVFPRKIMNHKIMKQPSFFNANFQNLFQDLVYYKILGCQTL